MIYNFLSLVQIATQNAVVLRETWDCAERASQTLDPFWAMVYKNREWNCQLLQYYLRICVFCGKAVWILFCWFFVRRKFSDSIVEMLVVCATTVHRVGLQTAPNELCPRVPLMAWNTCAFTIQAIGTGRLDLLCYGVSFHVFAIFKMCLSSQKTYCMRRTNHSLDPYKTDRWGCHILQLSTAVTQYM